MNRDYLQTIRQLSTVNSETFWEEEICYVLNNNREVQIKYLGSVSEYFRRLLKDSGNPFLQQRLLTKAIINTVKYISFDQCINHIEEETVCRTINIHIELVRAFCIKDAYLIELLIDFFISLYEDRLLPRLKASFFLSSPINGICISIKYLVDDFLPKNYYYIPSKENASGPLIVEKYFLVAVDLLLYSSGELFSALLIQLIKYNVPFKITDELLLKIERDVNISEAVIVEFKNNPKKFQSLLSHYLNFNETSRTRKLQTLGEFEIDVNLLIPPDRKVTKVEIDPDLISIFNIKAVESYGVIDTIISKKSEKNS